MGSEAGPSESIGKEYVSWDSPAIGRRMEVNIWGSDAADHACIVFPSSEGRFFQYEDEGMIGAMWHLIESKRLQLFCVDSIDSETFFAGWKRAEDRARRHLDYERYIMEEVVPFVRKRGDPARRLGATGVSWGGYHCVNSIFKFPEVFSFCVSMSGVLSLRDLLGDFVNDDVYFNDPTMYLPNLSDEKILGKLRKNKVILALGGGRWEEESRRDCRLVSDILSGKGVPVWMDEWGTDMDHDWPTWRIMAPYHFGKIVEWFEAESP